MVLLIDADVAAAEALCVVLVIGAVCDFSLMTCHPCTALGGSVLVSDIGKLVGTSVAGGEQDERT